MLLSIDGSSYPHVQVGGTTPDVHGPLCIQPRYIGIYHVPYVLETLYTFPVWQQVYLNLCKYTGIDTTSAVLHYKVPIYEAKAQYVNTHLERSNI